jgi:hypothetical protein
MCCRKNKVGLQLRWDVAPYKMTANVDPEELFEDILDICQEHQNFYNELNNRAGKKAYALAIAVILAMDTYECLHGKGNLFTRYLYPGPDEDTSSENGFVVHTIAASKQFDIVVTMLSEL